MLCKVWKERPDRPDAVSRWPLYPRRSESETAWSKWLERRGRGIHRHPDNQPGALCVQPRLAYDETARSYLLSMKSPNGGSIALGRGHGDESQTALTTVAAINRDIDLRNVAITPSDPGLFPPG